MDEQVIKVPTDRRIAALAERQHGVVSRAQLVDLGLSRGEIDGRLRRGQLHQVHRGVYAFGRPSVNGSALIVAAVLACGDRAVASHRTAAAIWGIRASASRRIEITTRGAKAPRKGVLIHRNQLARADITALDRIPLTTTARTLIDLADVLSTRALERAFDEAEYLRLDCSGLGPIRGRRGYGRLSHVLRRHAPGTTRTRSGLEERFLELCSAHDLPRPRVNALLGEYEVDFHFPHAGLVVELDGDAAHRTKKAFEADRIRDAELTVRGQRVVRITDERLDTAPAEVVSQLRLLTRMRR